MKYLTTTFALISYLFFNPAVVSAQVYKCEESDGKLAYQQTPCATGQRETRPAIMRGPTLTDEERFNAAAYAEGMTPAEARRLLGNRDSEQQEAAPPAFSTAPQVDYQAQRQRESDCNRRYDELAAQARDTFRSSKAQGNLRRHLEQIENGRTSCLYGTGSAAPSLPDTSQQRVGLCQGQCASEQGICISQCQGNGQCVAACAASHGRCTATCVR